MPKNTLIFPIIILIGLGALVLFSWEAPLPPQTPVIKQYAKANSANAFPSQLPLLSPKQNPVQPSFNTNSEIGLLKKDLYELSSKGSTEVLKFFEDYPPGLQRMELLNFYIEITPKDKLPQLLLFFEKSDYPEDFVTFKKLIEKAGIKSSNLINYYSPEATNSYHAALREAIIEKREIENLKKNSFLVAEETEKWIAGQTLPHQTEWINAIYSNVIASEAAKFALEKTSLISSLNDSNKQTLFERLASTSPETYANFVYNYSRTEKDPSAFSYYLRKWRDINPDSAEKWLNQNLIQNTQP